MMSSRIYLLLRKIHRVDGRGYSTAVKENFSQREQLEPFRTMESNPVYHNQKHYNRYYTVPEDVYTTIFQKQGLPSEFQKQVQAFCECSLLVRNPAIELISYLNQTDYKKPVNRYVLYGKYGTGKTITMSHMLHYAYMKKFILVHVPCINHWFRFPKDVTTSPLVPDMIDLPIHVGQWLQYFRNQNQQLLTELQLTTSKDYNWNSREATKCGETLLQLIDFGIKRIKFASGVADALVNELKLASIAGKCKTFVAIDGVNAIFAENIGVYEAKKPVPPNKITIVQTFLNCLNYDWCNGAVLLTVDSRSNKDRRDSDLPRYLLGKEGFDYLDPFVPILLEEYTPDEYETVIEYYKNRKWIRDISPKGQKELEAISNRNPFDVFHFSKPL